MPDLMSPEGSEALYSRLSPERRNLQLDPHLNGIQDLVEMAYGTPHEAYLRGDVAFGADPNNRQKPVPVEPTREMQQRYANTFAESLRNPILALGLDYSKLAMIPDWMNFRTAGNTIANGQYYPNTDTAVSNGDRRGGVDGHEMMHRGFYKLGGTNLFGNPKISVNEQHELMQEASRPTHQKYMNDWKSALHRGDPPLSDASYGVPDPYIMAYPEDKTGGRAERLQQLQDRAAQIMYERRPFGGPR